jgi:hypothetical protein
VDEIAAILRQRVLATPPIIRAEHAEHFVSLQGRDVEYGAADEVAEEEDPLPKAAATGCGIVP